MSHEDPAVPDELTDIEACMTCLSDETARIYAEKAAAPLVAEAIFADYVRGRLAALRDLIVGAKLETTAAPK